MKRRTVSLQFEWFDESGEMIGDSHYSLSEATFSIPFRRGDFVKNPYGGADFKGYVGDIDHSINEQLHEGEQTLVHTIRVSFSRSTRAPETK